MINYISYLTSLSSTEHETEIDEKISDSVHEIIYSKEFLSESTDTNATGWVVDDYEITGITFNKGVCIVSLDYKASGEQDEDRPSCGSSISGTAKATIDSSGNVTYGDITASVDDYWDQ